VPSLILYGEHDDVIPIEPTRQMLMSLPGDDEGLRRVALYENGYHMLIRDVAAETVWQDIEAWINSPEATLPSGADHHAARLLN